MRCYFTAVPRTPFDLTVNRNAIKVENIGRIQVGHISRQVAARLAPLMDRGSITLEGVVHEGKGASRIIIASSMGSTFPLVYGQKTYSLDMCARSFRFR